ncbi:MAG: hypothetical protein HZA52_04910 [Planctomycetes bacterium]|nr:hypothetical protein [Planctomycetota bacterium]
MLATLALALAPLSLTLASPSLTLAPLGAGDKPLAPADAKKLRQSFTEALGDSTKKCDGKALALAKTLGAKHPWGELADALRAGPVYDAKSTKPRKVGKEQEKFTEVGKTTVGFSFECDGLVLRYAVDVPPGYDAKEPVPLLVDPGHGSGADEDDRGKAGFLEYFRNQANEANLRDWLIARTEIVEQIGAGGKRGAKPEDQVARAFAGFLRDVSSRFAIDPDRVYFAGLSQTGFWSWYVGRALSDRVAGIAPMSSVTWHVNAYLENFAHVPIYVLHGENDPICRVEQPRATCEALTKLGLRVEYDEIDGAAHDFGVFGELDRALLWLAKSPRVAHPARVAKHLLTLETPWCHWLRVDELEKPGDGRAGSKPVAFVDGAIEGQRVTLSSRGVKRLTLALDPELVDLATPLEVIWNGKSVHTGVVAPDFEATLGFALEKTDWRALYAGRLELRAP